MNACARGDVQLMRQLITDGQGGVNDRLSSSGKTPLLVAIESNSLEAIKYLLQAGSDPNIGDDEGILPVFACLGIRKIKRDADGSLSHHLQRTPSGQDWLETLELLIQYGASVHEIVANKTMTMTNICNRRHGEGTLVQFFRLLVNEHYQDFDVVGRGGYSALISAIRGRNSAAAALDLLAKAGVSLDRVSKDGRHPLHLAAAEGHDSKPLEHLYGTYGINDINRQDSWGWTPLHGAIDSDSNKFHHEHCGKVRFLLANGADPNIKGLKTKMKSFRRFEKYLTPVELAAHLGTKVYENFLSDLKAAIGRTNDDDDDGMFFDAEEKWSTV
ncbi:ankyrin [Westerdykella ornata]|uniref:Ankyrin n=1 Tax=Westerdykella ornata TaxID=318751 RepID=A0A6A6JUH2_WESOR|nr:ankyrin [Westerdykella ornata]KAF2278689.1 ankyrin [Westerdykella ornata]